MADDSPRLVAYAEPSFADFEKLMQTVTPFNPDVVIGIGGGSVLDIAKLVAAQLENEQQLKDYVGIGLLKGRKKKLIYMFFYNINI